jgi:RND family efflux transporter MFP subunit
VSIDRVLRACKTSAVAALILLPLGCSKPPPSAPPPPDVSVAVVVQKTVKDWDEYTGRLQAIENVEVRPRVSGYIDKIEFTQGKLVKEGDLLVRIDPRPYQAKVDSAMAELRRAKVGQELAGKELARVEKLKATGAVSTEEVDERSSGLSQAEANVGVAEAALDSAALDLSFTQVKSPINGRVSRAEVTRGNLVSGGFNGGTLLTSVVSIDPIYVEFESDENAYLRYAKLVRSGALESPREIQTPIEVGLANEDGYPHPGMLTFVDNQLNPQTGTVRARAVLENKSNYFTPGLFVRVRVLVSASQLSILVDDRAISSDQAQKYVLVLGAENKTEYRAVKLGPIIDGLRVVRAGLKPGEQILVDGLQRVHPGMPVNPKVVEMGSRPAGEIAAAPAADDAN